MSLTSQQHRLLTFIADRLRATGVCPSTDDMMAALGTRGRGNVNVTIGMLEERGYLRRLFRGYARCIEILRLPDDVSAHWLQAVSTGSIVRELIRRGIGPQTRPGHALCPRCGVERPDDSAAACRNCRVVAAAAHRSMGPATARQSRDRRRLRAAA